METWNISGRVSSSQPLSSRKTRRAIAGATAIALTGLLASRASAASVNVTWTDTGGNNLWSNAANWSPADVPNNGTNGFSDYNVSIGTPSPTYEDISPTIDNLTINSGGNLIINPNQILTIAGPTVTDNGSIQVDNNSGNAAFNFSGNTTISGTGSVILDDYSPYARLTTKAGVTLTQSAGHTISGTGEIDAALVNNGTVNANSSSHPLLFQTNNMSNNSLFEATGGGTLSINGITITQGTGAQIVAGSSSAVNITGCSIIGGTLNGSAGSFSLTSDTLTNGSISTGSTIVLTAGTTVNVAGTSLTNNGTIQVDQNSQNANLNFTSNITVGGTGTILLYDNSPHPTFNTSNGATVTLSAGQTLDGEGIVNASLINNGTVNANYYGQTLTLQTSAMTNNNLFEAAGGGTLNINGITVTQGTGAQILEGSSSAVNISNCNISGGTLNGSSIAVSNSSFSNVNIATGTTLVIQPNTNLNILGTLNNNGTIQVDNNSGAANLNFNNSTTITGTGGIYLFDNSPHPTLNTSAGATITLSAGQTLYGEGIVNASLINQGIINASTYGNPLVLQTNAMTNNNLFEATGGGTLNINGITVTQAAAAQIVVGSSSAVNISACNISGGTLNASNGAPLYLTSTILSGVTIYNGSTVILTPSTTVNIIAPLTNNGTIQVDQNSGNANLNFLTSTTIAGTGSIYLFDNSPHPTLNASAGALVTLSAGQTLYGEGIVNASLVNLGVVNASVYGNTLTLQTNAMTNNNLFEATGGGILNITGITVTQPAGAQIFEGTSSAVNINNSNINGGNLNAASGVSIYLTSSNLSNIAITNGSSVVLSPGTTVNIIGTFSNNGAIQVDTNSSNANLNFTNTTTVNGTGTIYLYDNSPSPTINASGGATVTFSAGQTIYGEGIINAAIINNGIINGSTYGNSITLQTNPMTNNNLFEATGGGILDINGISINNSNGTIAATANSLISVYNGATISGGVISAAASGEVSVSGATFTNVNLATGTSVLIQPGKALNINGPALINSGSIQVDNNSSDASLNFLTTTAVSGTGSIYLYDNSPSPTINTSSGAVVTFGAGQTIYGEGVINAALINNGIIDASVYGNSITLQTNPMTNNNLFEATNGGQLNINGIAVNNSNGIINAAANSVVSIYNSANISGGIVSNAASGYISVAGATFTNVNFATGTTVVVQPSQFMNVNGLTSNGAPILTDDGTTTFGINPGSGILPRYLTSLTINSGGLFTVTAAPNRLNRTPLLTSTLTLAGSTNAWQAKLELGNNDMDVSSGSLSTITNQIAEGFNNGKWNGSEGITSATATADTRHLTALGIIQNNQSGTAIFTASNKFDGFTPGAGDILVKYTYYGDANLDGKVDGSDYSLIDVGYLNQLTSWYNGDFNYDGVVNGSDYTLIDNAYNTQGAQITAELAAPSATPTAVIAGSASASAVPEPASFGLAAIAVASLLGRRRK